MRELSELILKAGPNDRNVTNVDANSFTTIWVDPDNAMVREALIIDPGDPSLLAWLACRPTEQA
jgi:hypothetical protein